MSSPVSNKVFVSTPVDSSSSVGFTHDNAVATSLKGHLCGKKVVIGLVVQYAALTFSDISKRVFESETKEMSEFPNDDLSFKPTPLLHTNFFKRRDIFLKFFNVNINGFTPETINFHNYSKFEPLSELYHDFEFTLYIIMKNQRSKFLDFDTEHRLQDFVSELLEPKKLQLLSDVLLVSDKVISEPNSGLNEEEYNKRLKSIRNRLLVRCDNEEGRFIQDALKLFGSKK